MANITLRSLAGARWYMMTQENADQVNTYGYYNLVSFRIIATLILKL